MGEHASEIAAGDRFEFGRNWSRFLRDIDEQRIRDAEASLRAMLECEDLEGRSFLDVGSGSGLFSLAARRLGARVHSFDYDPASVACTAELQRRFSAGDPHWTVEEGSVLDDSYLSSLGHFDVVYAWGVLHHTGDLWKALVHASRRVAPGGQLFVAIYNDQGLRSRLWRRVKRIYCSGLLGRASVCAVFVPYFFVRGAVQDLARPWKRRGSRPQKDRGMSRHRDWFDWLGGHPFEVARPEKVLRFLRGEGFVLEGLQTTNRRGCNQFVFRKPAGMPRA